MNVRCPSCGAVFPAGPQTVAGAKAVECPLCLLRFEAKGEETVSLPEASQPNHRRGGPTLVSDDEFESFGSVGTFNTTSVTPQGAGLPTGGSGSPGGITGATVTLGSMAAGTPLSLSTGTPLSLGSGTPLSLGTGTPVSLSTTPAREPVSLQTDPPAESAEIDFDALLSDAVLAVEKRPEAGERTNPFGRISAPRGSTQQILQDDIFAGTSKASATTIPKIGLPNTGVGLHGGQPGVGGLGGDDDSLFEAPGTVTARDDGDDVAPKRLDFAEGIQKRPDVRRRPEKKAKPTRKIGRAVGTFVLLVGIGGAAADFAGYGFFGSKLWLPEDPAARRPKDQALTADLRKPIALLDTRKTYEAEIARLEQVLSLQPGNAEARQAVVERYLDLFERFPAAFTETPELKKRMDAALQRAGGGPSPRLAVLEALHGGQLDGLGEKVAGLDKGTVDDQAVAARVRVALWDRRLEQQALQNPGLIANLEKDPLRLPGTEDKALEQAHKALQALKDQAAKAPNAAKLALTTALVSDRRGQHAGLIAGLDPIAKAAPEHVEVRLLLASAHLEEGRLPEAEALAAEAHKLAGEAGQPALARDAALTVTRVAARRGDREGMIRGLQAALQALPADELSTVRLARLLLAEKRADDCQKLLVAKKKDGFKSVAFEVTLVEFWLYANRSEDALEELKEATKLYPQSIDVLFLRGQVEEKQQHPATARDFFAQVIAKEPRHLRAIMRLAELQAAAGRHDEALQTLTQARKNVGEDETVLRLMSEELHELKRDGEARQLLAALLKLQPDNRLYLLRAAQMDLQAGEVDRALGFLRRLRERKALDREAAMQMAQALGDKKQPREAAATLLPFADQSPADVELNTQAGRHLVDDKDYDRAQVVLQRATQVANGKSPEALFHYGRLAFGRGDADQGISRIKQAIAGDPMAHVYRFELARALFDLKAVPGSRDLAVTELQTIVRGAQSYQDAGKPVTYMADVHRLLARAALELHKYVQAIPHLKEVLARKADDAAALTDLGRAAYFTNDPDAPKYLREVLRIRPSDGKAALYLGLVSLRRNDSSEALRWLQHAAQSNDADLAEAWYHVALIYKEREQFGQALRAVDNYRRVARADDPYRDDAETLQRNLQGAPKGRRK